MSGPQTTLADRTPSILNKEPVDRRSRTERPPVALKHDFDPTGLVQRCVIIQRDENGFGLTVSGDNPVFVQLVKEDGAAMRAGVQTGDRIIKVNGTLVTHSNHIEVVKLIKSGSYVALTVLGRPPGLPQIPLDEEQLSSVLPVSTLHSPILPGGGRSSPLTLCPLSSPHSPHSPQSHGLRPLSPNEEPPQKESRISRSDSPVRSEKPLQIQISPAEFADGSVVFPHSDVDQRDMDRGVEESGRSSSLGHGSDVPVGDTPIEDVGLEGQATGSAVHTEDGTGRESKVFPVPSPPHLPHPQIIGAEDDYFELEQINGQCSCFQCVDLLKCRPAHLSVFLHHVVSQFDPAPLLCFLFADLHKQTSAKESRRFFIEFHSLFLDRAANLKVPVPEAVAAELEKRRVELLPEETCKHFTQMVQESLLSELQRLLEDFRQKRSMGLTLAEEELSKLELDQTSDPAKDQEQQVLERECCCAEGILTKIDDILMASPPSEEEKSTNMQYVIQTYMKHLGVKVKEVKGLEHKRPRSNFLPKIPAKKKAVKAEKESKEGKEGEEKVKKLFHNILPTPRRLTRVDSTSVGKVLEMNKQRSPKQLPQPSFTIPEQTDANGPQGPSHSSALVHTAGHTPEPSGHESDSNVSPLAPGPRLCEGHQSAETPEGPSSSLGSQFDFSPPNTEHLQEDDQEAFSRRSDPQGPGADVLSEDDQGADGEEEGAPTWQSAVNRDVLMTLTHQEVERQEVINELFHTERTHVRKLKVLDCVFYQRLSRDSILPAEDLRNIFSNLQEIIQLHVVLSEQMAAVRRCSESPVLGHIGEDLLTWFSGEEEQKIKQAVALFCSNLPSALELIRTRQKKDQRFASFMQEAESNRLCRRLQLKDIIPVEMQRLTKYPLLLDNIAKYTDDVEERRRVKRAAECCKKILNHINQAVKEAENTQRLREYQKRLDMSSLKQSENPVILEVKNLDLTQKKLVHEGPLSWKLTKDKAIDMYTLLLEDVLVLLQKQDERFILKLHGKTQTSAAESKLSFSPVIRLSAVLVRPVATDLRSFFVLSMSDNVAQIYELTAPTISDQRTWQRLITQCADSMKARLHNRDTTVSTSDAERKANEIIHNGLNEAKDSTATTEDVNCSDVPSVDTSPPPLDGLKHVEERVEEQVVDEAELEAFLDGQLAERLDQETLVDRSISNHLHMSASKAEDALHTLSVLKQLLMNHMLRETSGPTEDHQAETGHAHSEDIATHCEETPEGPRVSSSTPQSPEESPTLWGKSAEDTQPEPTDQNPQHNGLSILDLCGVPEDISTDDDVGIDMTKLLSSSSQTEGAGPNLSRQLMTHLRLLQQDLHYLKEVEVRYRQLQHSLSDTATDSDDCTDSVI